MILEEEKKVHSKQAQHESLSLDHNGFLTRLRGGHFLMVVLNKARGNFIAHYYKYLNVSRHSQFG